LMLGVGGLRFEDIFLEKFIPRRFTLFCSISEKGRLGIIYYTALLLDSDTSVEQTRTSDL